MPSWKKVVLHGASGSLAHLKLENLTSQNVLGTDAQGNVVAGSVSGYTLPTATDSVLGGVKVGGTLIISNGVLSARTYVGAVAAVPGEGAGVAGIAGYVPSATAGQSTYFLRGDGTWAVPTNTVTRLRSSAGTSYLTGDLMITGSGATSISVSGSIFTVSTTLPTPYSLPIATASTLGGIKIGSGLTIDRDTGIVTAAAGTSLSVDRVTFYTGSLTLNGDGATTVSYVPQLGGFLISSTDTDTTYTAGTGLTLSGTTFSVTPNTYASATHTHDDRYLRLSDTGSFFDRIIDSAPGTLDTLNELAAAIGDDANFSASIARVLAEKANANHTHNYDNYQYWTVADRTTSTRLESTNTLNVVGSGAATVTLDAATNTLTISSTDNDTTYAQATSSTLGLVKIGYTANAKNYPVALDGTGKMYVNVPWTDTDTDTVTKVGVPDDLSSGDIEIRGAGATTVTKSGGVITISSTDTDTNTTYSAGTGLTLSGTTFSVTANTYAPFSHTHSYLPLSGGTLTGTLTIAAGQSIVFTGWGESHSIFVETQGGASNGKTRTIFQAADDFTADQGWEFRSYRYDGATATRFYIPGNGGKATMNGANVATETWVASQGYLTSYTDTDTITKVGVPDDLSSGDIEFRGDGATTITKSGNTITISSTDTDTNTTYSAGTNLSLSGTTFNVSSAPSFGSLTVTGTDWYLLNLGARGASAGAYGIGNRSDESYRQLTFHVPNQAAYSNTGTVPSFGWYSNNATQLMKLDSESGNLWIKGSVEADGRIYADNGLHVRGDWVRVNGSNGLYFETYGGGWHMSDSTWIRSYGSKNVYMNAGVEVGSWIQNAGDYKVLNAAGNGWVTALYRNGGVPIYQGSSIDTRSTRVTSPSGAVYVTSTSSVRGAWKIKLPTGKRDSSTMMRMTVKIYQYSTGNSYTIELGGYNYSGGGWYNVFAHQVSDAGGQLKVRFGYDSTGDCIWIGETDSSWSYPQVFVTDFQAGYNGYDTGWTTGWSITPVESFDTVEQERNAAVVVTANNVGSYALTSLPSHNHDDRYYTESEVDTLLGNKQDRGSYLTSESDTLATVTGRGNSTSTALYMTGGTSSTPALHIRSGGSSWSEGLAVHPSSDSGYALAFFRTKAAYTDQTNTWAIGNLGDANARDHFGLLRKGLTGSSADRASDAIFTINPNGTFKFGFDPYVGANKIVHAGNVSSYALTSLPDHTHAIREVEGLEDALNGKQAAGSYVIANGTTNDNIDSDWGQSFKTFDPVPGGTPPIASPNIRTINVGNDYNRRTQLAFTYATDQGWFRRRTEAGWGSWREFIHSGNIGSQSVNYATSAGSANAVTWDNVSSKPSLDYQQDYTFTAPASTDGSGYSWVRVAMGGFNGGGDFVRFSINRAIYWNGSSPYGGPSMDVTAYSREWHGGQEGAVITYGEHGSVPGSGWITHAGPRDQAGSGYWFYMRIWGGVDYVMRVRRGSGSTGTRWEETSDPGSVYAIKLGVNNIGASHTGFNTNGPIYGSTVYSGGNAVLTSLPSHNHDDRYYTESEVDTLLSNKQDRGSYLTSESDTLATVTGRGATTTANVRFGSYVDISPSNGAFRFYDGSTFRGGLGLDSWAHSGGSAADLNMYVNGDNTLWISTNGVRRHYFNSGEAAFRTYSPDLNYKISVIGGDQFNAYYSTSGATMYINYHSNNGASVYIAGRKFFFDNSNSKLVFSKASGTIISHGSMDDAIGYNSEQGTYIGSAVGGRTYYIYGNGSFYDNGTMRTLLNSGNYSSYALPLSGGTVSGNLTTTGIFRVFNYDHPNGTGWDTAIEIGETSTGTVNNSYPTYINNGYGVNIRKNSDGVFLGLVTYDGGSNFHSVIGWGDDAGENLYFRFNGSDRGVLDSSGNLTVNGNITGYSDARVKTNVKTIENALDKVTKLRGVTFNRTDIDDTRTNIGVIAQEVKEVVPEVVSENESGMHSVAYGNITALLIEAIKDQQALIEQQQKQIDELKALVNGLTK